MKRRIHRIPGQLCRQVKRAIGGARNVILRATGDSLRPKWIVFEVTDRCNSRCVHCNIWRRTPTENVLIPERIGLTFSDVLFKDVECVIVTGGEPTVRDDLEEIYLRMHEALPKAVLQLSTNGLQPERVINIVKTALAHGIRFEVGVSLDGIGDEHDRIRGVKGNFQRVDRLLHELVELRENHRDRLGVDVGIVISDLTLPSVAEVRRYAKELDIGLTEAWYNEAPYYDNLGGKIPVSNKLIRTVESQRSSLLQERWLDGLRGKSIKFPCFAMYTFFLLKCNGDVSPCLKFSNLRAGNVRQKTPTEIWCSSEAKKVRKTVKDCQGCLNSWGAGWSFESSYYPFLLSYLKRPRTLIDKWARH
jgi:MoaA/NifB/PqqE/SkfB family radical SAM enzyme